MDLMVGYGSESDGEPGEGFPVVPPPPSAVLEVTPTTVTVDEPKKKKKKINISVLPQAIQDGLLRGIANDSDDDMDTTASTVNIAKSATAAVRSTATRDMNRTQDDPLLRMLASVPLQDTKAAMEQVFVSSAVKPVAATPAPKPVLMKLPAAAVEPVTVKSSTQSISSVININSHQLQTPSDLPRSSAAAATTTVAGSSSSSHSVSSVPVSIDWSQVHQPRSTYSQQLYAQQLATSQHTSFPDDTQEDGSMQSNRKRKERELEHRLAAGDLSTLSAVHMHDVQQQSAHAWDADSYRDQQQREAEIMNQYTNNGAMKSIAQPTKTQNRKHQLSSLALRAAETEIAQMDVRIQKGKSKSQTQNKYGW